MQFLLKMEIFTILLKRWSSVSLSPVKLGVASFSLKFYGHALLFPRPSPAHALRSGQIKHHILRKSLLSFLPPVTSDLCFL